MLNLDFDQRVVVSTDKISWQDSGKPGIDIKPLAIEDSETGHLTAMVRYRKGSIFARKEHSYGEEMIVLKGTFFGQYENFGTGTYYRSPPNHESFPIKQNGCVLFLKLNQLSASQPKKVKIDTLTHEWLNYSDSIQMQLLYKDVKEQSHIFKWSKGAKIREPDGSFNGAEMFILKGIIKDEQGEYLAGTWLRAPKELLKKAFALEETVAFVKYGHFSISE